MIYLIINIRLKLDNVPKMLQETIAKKTEYLFNRSYDDDLSDEQEDALLDYVSEQINTYGWQDTFNSWLQYLYHNCTTAEGAMNFANLFWWFGGQDHIIPEPHKFIAYFYYRINYDTAKYDPSDVLDSIAITILPRAGFSEADLTINTGYMPENDPLIKVQVDEYANQGF